MPVPTPLQSRRKDDANGFPPRTRQIQKNRESLDLDDVMGGFDDEDTLPKTKPASKSNTHLARAAGHVSSSTRELIDFLAEGPPDSPTHLSFPNGATNGNSDSTKLKGSGRLQRMISKLSLSNTEKMRGHSEDTPGKSRVPPSPIQNWLPISQKSSPSNQYLANRPIPPRPPKPYSPPPSPPLETAEKDDVSARKRSVSLQSPKRSTATHPSPSVPPKSPTATVHGHAKPKPDTGSPIAPRQASNAVPSIPSDSVSPRTSLRKVPPTYIPDVIKSPTTNSTEELRNLFTRATSADECRLILDMLLMKNGARIDIPKQLPQVTSESTPTHVNVVAEDEEATLELHLVQFLLCDSSLSIRAPDLSKSRSDSSVESFSSVQSSPAPLQQENESSSQVNGHNGFPPGLANGEAKQGITVES